MTPFGWLKMHAQSISAAAAILVSMVALYVAWDQSRVMRAQQHASVWPALQIERTFLVEPDGYILSFSEKNDGIGPAIVETVTAEIDGFSLSNWEDLERFRPEGLSRPGMWTGGLRNEILASGEEVLLATLTWPREEAEGDLVRAYRDELSDLLIDICFCSVYGRCWMMSRSPEAITRTPVRSCPLPDPDSDL